jgi:hypothetical protein
MTTDPKKLAEEANRLATAIEEKWWRWKGKPQIPEELQAAECLRQLSALAEKAEQAPLLTAEALWENEAVMALNAELGLSMDRLLKLVRAANNWKRP